ncbi:MAG: prepilin-type N-terminal cleavage/methylation domain-containing protein [Phycisphaerales bacterium]|nr:prepilin-type N-terminal cleavage/methylation domain-containing protein [Phycisphaerales bacterium]
MRSIRGPGASPGTSRFRHAHIARARARAQASDDGFTLLETIIVILILGVIASVIVPRALSVGRRQSEAESKQVQRLISVALDKARLWNQPAAIEYREENPSSARKGERGVGRLSVWSMRADAAAVESDATGAARTKWSEDGLVEPVFLTRTKLALATQNGQPLPPAAWRITLAPGQPRPLLVLNLEGDAGTRFSIRLEPDAPGAIRIDETPGAAAKPAGSGQRSIDLDDTGRGQSTW